MVGSSYGGYLASILSSLRAIEWLALRVPALYVDAGWEIAKLRLRKEQNLDAYRQTIIPAPENRALRADHGLTDESMRRDYTVLLFNWLSEMLFGLQKPTTASLFVNGS